MKGGKAVEGDIMQRATPDHAMDAFAMILAIAAYVAILVTTLLTLSTTAHAASERVRSACKHDYLSYCSQHSPEGPAVRQCMNAHGPQLSKACVDALVADGEVSRSQVERRKTASQR